MVVSTVPSLLDAITIVQPETVIRWHRRGFRAYWRSKSRHLGGHVTDISRARTSHYGASARRFRAGRSSDFCAIAATNATTRPKAAGPNDGSMGDEFGCAPARRFDGATRLLPTP